MTTARWTRLAWLSIALIFSMLIHPSTLTRAAEPSPPDAFPASTTVVDYVVVADECFQLTGTLRDERLATLEVAIPGYKACIEEPDPMAVSAKASSETRTNKGYLLRNDRCFEVTTGRGESEKEVDRTLCATTVAAAPVESREETPRREAGYDRLAGGCVNTVIDIRERRLMAYFTIAAEEHCGEVLVPAAERAIQPTDGAVLRRIESEDDVPRSSAAPAEQNFLFDAADGPKVTNTVNLTVGVQGNNYVFTATTNCCFQQHHWYFYTQNGTYYYITNTGTSNQVTFTRPLTIQGSYRVKLLGRIWNSSNNSWNEWEYFSNWVTLPLPQLVKGVEYRAHVAQWGWLPWVLNGAIAGTTGQGRRMEAVQIRPRNMPGVWICYQAHVAGYGWLGVVCNGATGGTTGQSRRMEAVRVWVLGAPVGCNINYQAHVANLGWLAPVSNGAIAGTTGQSRQMEAVRIWLSGPC